METWSLVRERVIITSFECSAYIRPSSSLTEGTQIPLHWKHWYVLVPHSGTLFLTAHLHSNDFLSHIYSMSLIVPYGAVTLLGCVNCSWQVVSSILYVPEFSFPCIISISNGKLFCLFSGISRTSEYHFCFFFFSGHYMNVIYRSWFILKRWIEPSSIASKKWHEVPSGKVMASYMYIVFFIDYEVNIFQHICSSVLVLPVKGI